MHFFTRATGKSIIAALAVTFAVISFSLSFRLALVLPLEVMRYSAPGSYFGE